ncbi:type II secretion system F family protein [Ferrimonas pelagia]
MIDVAMTTLSQLSPRAQLTLMLCLLFTGVILMMVMTVNLLRRNQQLSRAGIDITRSDQSPLQRSVTLVTKTAENVLMTDEQEMKDKWIAAGLYDTRLSKYFAPIKYGLFLLGVLGYYLYYGKEAELPTNVMAIAVWLSLTIVGPDFYLNAKRNALKKKLSGLLPYTTDLIAICVQSGMTIESSVRYLSQELSLFDKDLSYLLSRLNDKAKIVGMELALDDLYEFVPTPEFRSFVMTLKQSLKYGASIYTILVTLAEDIRQEQMLILEERIGKLGAKMSIPLILFVMMPVVILVAAPGVMRMLS